MVSGIAELGSLYRFRSGLWAPYYAIVQQELGATATLLDFGNQGSAGKVNATTWTGRKFSATGLSPVWTPSEALYAFDTPFDLTKESNWLGLAPILTLNGTDEEADTPDAAYWSRDDSGAGGAFSIGVWVNITDTAALRTILAKWDNTTGTELREWRFDINTSDFIVLDLYDESANVSALRVSDAAVSQGVWVFIVATYDSTGGATAANGITLYENGAVKASTATNNASYVAMENLAVLPSLGFNITTAGVAGNFLDGKMLGGPWSPFFVQAALTAAQVKNLYENMRLGLGI